MALSQHLYFIMTLRVRMRCRRQLRTAIGQKLTFCDIQCPVFLLIINNLCKSDVRTFLFFGTRTLTGKRGFRVLARDRFVPRDDALVRQRQPTPKSRNFGTGQEDTLGTSWDKCRHFWTLCFSYFIDNQIIMQMSCLHLPFFSAQDTEQRKDKKG